MKGKRGFYIVGVVVSILILAILVFAYGGTDPEIHGHSNQEVDIYPIVLDTLNSRVGIGTSSPARKLEIQDDYLRIKSTGSTDYGIELINDAGTATYLGIGDQSDASVPHDFFVQTNAGKTLVVTDSGNVGVGGITSPIDKLHVNGGIRSSGSAADWNNGDQLTLDYNGGNSRINTRNSGGSASLGLWTNSAERIHISSNGNVGIGTANPGYDLDVQGNINMNGLLTTSSSVGMKFPLKFYNCQKSKSQSSGTWDYHTWTDSDCTGDAGIPADNSYCMASISRFGSGGGTGCNAQCYPSQGATYACGGTTTYVLTCEYLCW